MRGRSRRSCARSPTTWASGTPSARRRSASSSAARTPERRPGARAGPTGRGPVLRRRRAGPHRLHRVRQLHGRLPGRRQEHAGQELPRPRRAARRAGRADAHGRRRAPARPAPPGAGLRGHDRAHGRVVPAGSGERSRPARSCWPPARGARRSCCTRCARPGRCRACPSGSASSPAPTPRRCSVRSRGTCRPTPTWPAAWPSPRRSIPTRTPTSRTCATARAPTRWGCSAPSSSTAGAGTPRWARWLGQAARRPDQVVRAVWVRRWSERTVIGLVMQSLDNSLTVSGRPRRFGHGTRLTSRQGHGEPNPTWIPVGHKAIRGIAARLQARTNVPADPGGTIGDVVDVPMTAHFLGGCVIGAGPDRGVIDPYQRVHGYPGLHVVDGAAVSANLGVNPSLTITAQAERAMSLWPNRSEADQRPAQGSAYVRLDPVAPAHPVVPDGAPAALRVHLAAMSAGHRAVVGGRHPGPVRTHGGGHGRQLRARPGDGESVGRQGMSSDPGRARSGPRSRRPGRGALTRPGRRTASRPRRPGECASRSHGVGGVGRSGWTCSSTTPASWRRPPGRPSTASSSDGDQPSRALRAHRAPAAAAARGGGARGWSTSAVSCTGSAGSPLRRPAGRAGPLPGLAGLRAEQAGQPAVHHGAATALRRGSCRCVECGRAPGSRRDEPRRRGPLRRIPGLAAAGSAVNRLWTQPAAHGAWSILRAGTDPDLVGGEYVGPSGPGETRGAPGVRARGPRGLRRVARPRALAAVGRTHRRRLRRPG